MSRSAFRGTVSSFRGQFMSLWRRLRREAQSDERAWSRLLVLSAVERVGDAATPTLLAEAENMRSSNMAAALRELEADGLVVRTPDTEDRRKVRVGLTQTGRDVLHENRARREEWLAEAIEGALTKEERALLFKAGELLNRVASYQKPAKPRTPD